MPGGTCGRDRSNKEFLPCGLVRDLSSLVDLVRGREPVGNDYLSLIQGVLDARGFLEAIERIESRCDLRIKVHEVSTLSRKTVRKQGTEEITVIRGEIQGLMLDSLLRKALSEKLGLGRFPGAVVSVEDYEHSFLHAFSILPVWNSPTSTLLKISSRTARIARAKAQALEKYTLESPHTQVLFTVSHLGFSHSTGKFLGYEGGFTLDRADLSKSSIDVTIKTDSIDMGDQKWDDHLKGADFFNVEKFPTMTFKSTSVAVTGENTADVTGDLTILGVTKPIVLKVKHNKSGPHPMAGDKFVAGFDASAIIKRSDFGLSYGLPMIGDDVMISLTVEGLQDGYKGAEKGKE